MHWIAPSEKDTATNTLEKRLWDAADQLRANSGLTSQQYGQPVLGLIFLRFADARFSLLRAELEKSAASSRRGSRVDDPKAYHAKGVLYLTPNARFEQLLALPEGANIGAKLNEAMAGIEKHNPQLAGVLPRTYQIFSSTLLKELLKKVSEIPVSLDYDAFGRIYEYFLGEFARTEGQKGGEFYTPASIVRLMVEILEPYHGRILDPACGSGGMFVQSARFVSEHQRQAAAGQLPSTSGRGAGSEGAQFSGDPSRDLSIYGQEKVGETVKLCRMNLAVHGLDGDIREVLSYYDDPHSLVGKFDFVLANPPFNVNAVDKERLKDSVGPGRRFPFGLPRTDNANYLWIQLFHSALNAKGRAGFVMANSASDARSSEQELRRQLIESRCVDVMVAVGPNLFYTVTLPCTLWFFDKSKASSDRREPAQTSGGNGNQSGLTSAATSGVGRADSVLFIDARHIYRQVDRAHRDWTPAQIGFLANIVRVYRGEEPDFTLGSEEAETRLLEVFAAQPSPQPSPKGRGSAAAKLPSTSGRGTKGEGAGSITYRNIAGLCRAATLKEIEAQGWSLNPGRYVGVAPGEAVSDEDFKEQLETLNEELETLNAQARELEDTIAKNVAEILEA